MVVALEKTKVTIKLNPESDPAYLPLKNEIEELHKSTAEMIVVDQQGIEGITNNVNLGSKIKARVEVLKKPWKAPALEAGRTIDAAFNALTKPIDEARTIAEKKVTDCRKVLRAEAERIEAENRRKEAERILLIAEDTDFETGEMPIIAAVEHAPVPIVADKTTTDFGSSRGVMEPKFRVVDFSKVPDSLKVLDEKSEIAKAECKVNAQLKAGVREIPGLEIWLEEATRFRSR